MLLTNRHTARATSKSAILLVYLLCLTLPLFDETKTLCLAQEEEKMTKYNQSRNCSIPSCDNLFPTDLSVNCSRLKENSKSSSCDCVCNSKEGKFERLMVSEREEENSLNIELKCKTMSIENDLRNFNLRNSSEKVEKLYISIEGGGSFWSCSIDTSIPKMFRVLGVQVEKLKLTNVKVNRLSSSEDHDTLTGLKSLELKKVSNSSSNSDRKIWLDLRGMKNLERLKVFSARPETVLEPKVFEETPNLEDLNLNGARIAGPLDPNLFSKLVNLTYLDLSKNFFEGDLPLNLLRGSPKLKKFHMLSDQKNAFKNSSRIFRGLFFKHQSSSLEVFDYSTLHLMDKDNFKVIFYEDVFRHTHNLKHVDILNGVFKPNTDLKHFSNLDSLTSLAIGGSSGPPNLTADSFNCDYIPRKHLTKLTVPGDCQILEKLILTCHILEDKLNFTLDARNETTTSPQSWDKWDGWLKCGIQAKLDDAEAAKDTKIGIIAVVASFALISLILLVTVYLRNLLESRKMHLHCGYIPAQELIDRKFDAFVVFDREDNNLGGDVVQRLIQECGLRCCSPDFFDVGYLADEIRNSANSSKLMVILLRTTEHKSNSEKISRKAIREAEGTGQKVIPFILPSREENEEEIEEETKSLNNEDENLSRSNRNVIEQFTKRREPVFYNNEGFGEDEEGVKLVEADFKKVSYYTKTILKEIDKKAEKSLNRKRHVNGSSHQGLRNGNLGSWIPLNRNLSTQSQERFLQTQISQVSGTSGSSRRSQTTVVNEELRRNGEASNHLAVARF